MWNLVGFGDKGIPEVHSSEVQDIPCMSKIVLSDLRVPKFGPKYSKWVYGGPRECDGVQGVQVESKGVQKGLRVSK